MHKKNNIATTFSLPQIVAIAVALLGGDIEPVDSEDIAIKVNELAPGQFVWRTHPEWIDLGAVQSALRHAKQQSNGALLVGDNTRGWMLSPAGIQWIQSIPERILHDLGQTNFRKESIIVNLQAECRRLRSTTAFRLYREGRADEIQLHHFFEFARINEYFQRRARQRRYTLIENAVLADQDLSDLWCLLKNRFREEMYK
ncbi:MAG: hypothetical protein QXZ17_10015 [Nitrososphaerota archaeon]